MEGTGGGAAANRGAFDVTRTTPTIGPLTDRCSTAKHPVGVAAIVRSAVSVPLPRLGNRNATRRNRTRLCRRSPSPSHAWPRG